MKNYDEWQITEKIGTGGFGDVYKATKTINNKFEECAIKYISMPNKPDLMSNNIKNKDDVINEIKILQKFKGNPYIVNYYDHKEFVDYENNTIEFYIRMELVEDIDKYFNNTQISENEVVKLGIDICNALELCQSINIIHKDIKPTNIFIDKNKNFKLGDFGISHNLNETNKYATYSYAAPEILKKQNITESSDLYSLGIVMYKLLNNNKLPFENKIKNKDKALNNRLKGNKIPSIPGVNKNLMGIILKACSSDIKNRYKNVKEMRNDLEKLNNISVKKTSTYVSTNIEKTLDIYENKTVLKKQIDKRNFQSFASGKYLKNIIKEHGIGNLLKSIMFILLLLILVFLLIRACTNEKKCDQGYINKDGICVKGYYSCDDGYILNDNNKCQLTLESIDARKNYECKDGYILNDGYCINKNTKIPNFVYKCADGFTLKGTKCTKTESAKAIITYSCPSNYILVGDQCLSISNIDANKTYVCNDSNYILSGDKCIKTTDNKIKAIATYTCNEGGTLNETKCDLVSSPSYNWYMPTCNKGSYNYSDRKCHYTYNAKVTYTCPTGVSDGKGYCIDNSTSIKNADIKYTCPEGYTAVSNQCAKTSGIKATPTYTCTTDTKLVGNMCYGTVSIDAVGLYECSKGYILSGQYCVKDDYYEAGINYTCSKLYTLNGTKCEKYKIVDPYENITDQKEDNN